MEIHRASLVIILIVLAVVVVAAADSLRDVVSEQYDNRT